MIRALILVAVLLGAFGCRSNKETSPIENELFTYLEGLSAEDLQGVILLGLKDSVLYRKAFGYASLEYQRENTLHTQFNIASITKMFTAVATLQLVEQGKLDLHTPIEAYLPDYPNKEVREAVTIHQLLTHTAGTRAFYTEPYLKSDKLQYREIEDYLPLFVRDSLLFEPGTRYQYNGSGFVILGLLIEKISGQSYYDYLSEQVFKTATMHNTSALEMDTIYSEKASGYTSFFGDQEHLSRNDYYISKASPAGGYFATAEDLFNFFSALRNHKLLKPETTELMFTSKVQGFNTHLGYGIDVDQRYGEVILGHSGGWYGVRTELMYFKDSEYTAVVLSNRDDDGKSGASRIIEQLKEKITGTALEN